MNADQLLELAKNKGIDYSTLFNPNGGNRLQPFV